MSRKKGKICIQLISDLVPGSGQGWANIIDSDIVYDQYGFPYIPARRIKGLIKESALELEELMPMYSIMEAKAYKWDMSENKIKTIMAVAHTDLGVLKLSDVVKRLLSETD